MSDDQDAKTHAWRLFLLAHTMLLERIETELNAAGLPPLAWYDVLWELERAEGQKLRMHDLAERIVMPRYNLTRLADRLELASLIQREDCDDDRRGYFLVITPEGAATRRKMWRTYGPLIEKLFGQHLSDADARVFAQRFSAMTNVGAKGASTAPAAAKKPPRTARKAR